MIQPIPTVTLPGGEAIPKLGQGTWEMGERPNARQAEIAALRAGVELGMTLVDTAEMYGDGESEKLIAEALGAVRDDVFLVSKVYPHNGSERGVQAACERSLKRLKTDRLDLYLLHWRGGEDLAGVVAGFGKLVRDGKIRHWGVSNFDVPDMEDLEAAGGRTAATNQVLYNLTRRGIEGTLLPHCVSRRIPIMAYSPIEQGRLLGRRALRRVATRRQATPAQVALAWVLRQDGVIAIPKAGSIDHVRENRGALDIRLTAADLAELDDAFPPPKRPVPLEML